jgi:hypothetical protein
MPGGSSSSPLATGTTWREWLTDLSGRVHSHWRLKALLAGSISFLFCVPYFLLGHFPVMPARELPLSRIDRAIGFDAGPWVWVYQSVYIPINVIPWLARRRHELAQYARGFAAVSLFSFIVFFLFPVRAPKPDVPHPHGMYWLLQLYDADYNALPSLHAALLVYTLCFGRRVFGRGRPPGLDLVCLAWAALILYATLATKEHYLVDIVAGGALALLVDALAWRRPDAATTPVPAPLPAES